MPAPALYPPSELADPDLRRALERMVRRVVPPQEVDDIVQEALAEALAARVEHREPRHLRHWLGGVVRHKVVDYHRRQGREMLAEPPDPGREADEGAERELLRWAERNLPGGRHDQQTFDWLLREGDGERLEEIARSEDIPAERVRQRVARMRRFLRERWVTMLAAACLGAVAWWLVRPARVDIAASPDARVLRGVEASRELGRRQREQALGRCEAGDRDGCVIGLDAAAALDPDGDRDEAVQRARRSVEPV
ncbi:MAG: sigma-70 family RNA polymerase sigma factor, partial [Myxococcales bacterium]